MDEHIKQNIRFDNRLESYRTFFDHEWAKNIDKLVVRTPFQDSVFNLCINWKAAANTCVMPWLMTTSVAGVLNNRMDGYEPLVHKIVIGLDKKLCKRMANKLKRSELQKLSDEIRKLVHETHAATVAAHQAVEPVKADAIWAEYIKIHEMPLAL